MSVVSATKLREESFSVSENKPEVTETWRVITDDVNDGLAVVLSAGDLPAKFEPHPDNATIKALEFGGRRVTGKVKWWEVEVTYREETSDDGKPDGDDDESEKPPHLRTPQMWTGTRQIERVNQFTIDHISEGTGEFVFKGYVNSAGEPFDPPAQWSDNLTVLNVFRYELKCPLKKIKKYQGAMNSVPWMDGLANSWLCEKYERAKKKEQILGVWVWPVEMTFVHDWFTWQHRELDHGNYYMEGGKKIPFVDEEGSPIVGRLDGTGSPLADDAEKDVILTFKVRRTADFNELNLPEKMPE